MRILRHIRRFGQPCLRVCSKNSPPHCFLTRRTPLFFTLVLDTVAVDEKVQRAGSTATLKARVERPLTTAKGAVFGHRPVQPGRSQ